MDFIEYLQEQFDCLIVGDQIRMANGICPFCGCQDDNLNNFIYEGDDLNV